MDKRHGTGRTRAPRARPREPTYGPGNLPRQHPARPLSPRASRQERMDRLVAGKPPWAQMTVTSVRAPSAPLCSGASRGHAPSGCGQATEAGSACPPSPVAAPCTGHSAVGPPSPQSPPEPPTTPITLLSSKAPPPRLPSTPALPRAPGAGAAGPAPPASVPLPRLLGLADNHKPPPGQPRGRGPRVCRFPHWCLPSGHQRIAAASYAPRAALDGTWGPGLPVTIQPDG